MASIADLAFYDGAATPLLRTLKAVDIRRENGVVTAIWREQLAGVPVDAQATVTARLARLKSGVYKTSLRTAFPYLETVVAGTALGYQAPPRVAYTDEMETIGFFSPRSVQTGRTSLRQFHSNICRHNTSSVAATLSGPGPELFDQLIQAT